MCAYLRVEEMERYSTVSDKDLNELFQEVRTKFKNQFFISETVIKINKWFGPDFVKTFYTVYNNLERGQINNINEVQCMIWYNEGSSINTGIEKSVLYAYFFGLLTNIKP